MFIMAKRNLVLPSADSTQHHRVQRDFVGEIPDWATKTRYFDRLVKDGKILIVPSHSDKDTQAAAEKDVEIRRGPADTKSKGKGKGANKAEPDAAEAAGAEAQADTEKPAEAEA